MKWIAKCENDKGGFFFESVEAMTECEARTKTSYDARYIQWIYPASNPVEEDGIELITCPNCGQIICFDKFHLQQDCIKCEIEFIANKDLEQWM